MQPEQQAKFSGVAGQLTWRAWLPAGAPHALLVLAHGFAEHIGRYAHVAEYFIARGYAVYAYDMIGHGKSDGKRGHVNRFADYLEDLNQFIAIAQTREPNIPTFLVGHSQGGLIALAYGERRPTGLRGIVVSAPGLRVALAVPAWKLRLGKILSSVIPTFSMPNGIPPEYLSRDSSVSSAYAQKDPLVGHVASARWATEFYRAQRETMAAASQFTLPCLIMQGSDDKLVSPEGAREFFAAAGSADKTLKIYQGLYHELFNEVSKEEVFEDMADWLESRR
jgi:alpha-beta hydrolase superfamily lysophospholipase